MSPVSTIEKCSGVGSGVQEATPERVTWMQNHLAQGILGEHDHIKNNAPEFVLNRNWEASRVAFHSDPSTCVFSIDVFLDGTYLVGHTTTVNTRQSVEFLSAYTRALEYIKGRGLSPKA